MASRSAQKAAAEMAAVTKSASAKQAVEKQVVSTLPKEKRGPHKPFGYLGARKAHNQKKKFGIVKFYPKPKTEEDWHEVYLRHEIHLPNVSRIVLHWSNKGPGFSGIRHFSVRSNTFLYKQTK